MKFLISLSAVLLSTTVITAFAAPKSGEEVYQKHCQACHSPQIAPMLKSPAVHDLKAWKPRLEDAGKKAVALKKSGKKTKVIDVLVDTVKAGMGAMPPGGTCGDCTDKEFANAIKFMSSKPKE